MIFFFRIFFSTFQKITVGGFVSQLIKKFWPKCYSDFNPIFLKDHNIKKNINIYLTTGRSSSMSSWHHNCCCDSSGVT